MQVKIRFYGHMYMCDKWLQGRFAHSLHKKILLVSTLSGFSFWKADTCTCDVVNNVFFFCISIYFFYEVFNTQINSILMITSEYVLVTEDRFEQAWNVG